MSSKQPYMTLYFLNASRAIRIAWLLEELDISYKLVTSPRAANGLALLESKAKIPTRLGTRWGFCNPGKRRYLEVSGFTVYSSSLTIYTNYFRYLIESYYSASRLLPQEAHARAKVREWFQASERTFMMNAVPIIMTRLGMPKEVAQYVSGLEAAIASMVRRAMQWLETELESGPSQGQFIVGTDLTSRRYNDGV
ncbi:hypothetical protein LB504_010405 [Fusarium proliferatum]|nr:hypothetical protein LB504_010405 [Fusarium proliferatum]